MLNIQEQVNDVIQQATSRQMKAVNEHASVWVSANAGTGKTYVLTNRVLRLLVNDATLNPSDILAVTFTKAAAREMENRIRERLAEWASDTDEVLDEKLTSLLERTPNTDEFSRARGLFTQVLDEAGGMNINTIHGFCQSLLGQFPIEAGISPAFRVLEGQEAKDLLIDAQNKAFRKHMSGEAQPSWAYPWFAASLSEGSLRDAFQSFVENHQRFNKLFQHFGSVNTAVEAVANALSVPTNLLPENIDDYKESIIKPNDELANKLRQLAEALNTGKATAQKRAEKIFDYINSADGNYRNQWATYKSAFLTSTGSPTAKLADADSKKAYGDILEDQLKTEQERVLEVDAQLAALETYLLTAAFLYIGQDVLTTYEQAKLDGGFLDFNDMIRHASNLLSQKEAADWVRFKMDKKIRHIMLDEAQDTDSEQWGILKSLVDEFYIGVGQHEMPRTFFAVGDMKQSIYRFRGAEPQVFSGMLSYMQSQPSTQFNKVGMETSFRSSAAVLNVTDQIFAAPHRKQAVDEIADDIMHSTSRIGQAGWVEVWQPIEAEKEDKNEEPWPLPTRKQQQPTAKTLLADKVAKSIKDLLNSNTVLATTGKPVSAGDVMILLRSRTMMGDIITALNKQNLHHTGADDVELLDEAIVNDLLALGKFLCNPVDDLSLVHTLRSPFFNFSNDDVLNLKLAQKQNNGLWPVLFGLKEEPYQQAANILTELLNLVDFLSPYALYIKAITMLDARGKFLQKAGMGLGDSALKVVNEPIDTFLDALLDFEQQDGGLTTFLNRFEMTGLRLKKELASAKGSIRILTAHSSKGLEAPVVYMPDTGRSFYDKTSKEKILWQLDENHKDTLCLYRPGSKKQSTLEHQLLEAEKELIFKDEMRLLYVAITRAKERLYMGVAGGRYLHKEHSWYAHIEQAIADNSSQWLDVDGTRIYSTEQQLKLADTSVNVDIEDDEIETPDWLFTNAPESISEKRHTASDAVRKAELLDLSEGVKAKKLYEKGRFQHRLLQMLPSVNPADQHFKAAEWLDNIAPDWDEVQRQNVLDTTFKILETHRKLFGENSRAEVPLTAIVDGVRLEGVVDRIVINNDSIWVIDYKTNRKVPKIVPAVYQKQMAAYKEAARKIFSDKEVKTYILWTENSDLVEV